MNNKNRKYLFELKILLDESKELYQVYINNKKKFSHAKKIKSLNIKILKKLNNQAPFVSKILTKSIVNLKKHLEEWNNCWNKKKQKQKPKDVDEFIFNGYSKFPSGFDELVTGFLKEKIINLK